MTDKQKIIEELKLLKAEVNKILNEFKHVNGCLLNQHIGMDIAYDKAIKIIKDKMIPTRDRNWLNKDLTLIMNNNKCSEVFFSKDFIEKLEDTILKVNGTDFNQIVIMNRKNGTLDICIIKEDEREN